MYLGFFTFFQKQNVKIFTFLKTKNVKFFTKITKTKTEKKKYVIQG